MLKTILKWYSSPANKKSLFALAAGVLIFLTIFPRITEVVAQNFIFGFDQGRDYLAVRSIVVDKKPTLIGSELGAGSAGFSGFFHGPMYFYFLAVPFFLFNGDPYGGVVLMFVLGIATVVLSFYVGAKLFDKLGGYLTALMVAISPPLIAQSRFVWNSYPSSLFILLVFYSIYQIAVEVRARYIFLAAFFSGFIYNFQTAMAIPLCITTLLYAIFIARLRRFSQYLYLLAGYLLAFSPMLFFELRHGFQGAKGMFSYMFKDSETDVTLLFMQRLLADHLNTFTYNFFDTFPRVPLPSLLLFLLIIPPFFYLLFREKKSPLKSFMIFLTLLPIVKFLVYSQLKNSVYPHYLYDLNFAYVFILMYIIFRLIKLKKQIAACVYGLIIVFFVVFATMSAVRTYRADVQDLGGDAKIKGKVEAIDYIYRDAKNEKFNLLVFAPPIYTYPYDYLLLWHGKKTYGYVPGTEKKGVFYLLIEQDHSKPWSYNGWLETVIKTGKIEKTVTLPNGFIIQKRRATQNEG